MGFHHFSDPSLPTIVNINAYNYALGDLMSHVYDSGKNPIKPNSRKHIPEELKYEIQNKDHLGIVRALMHRRAVLLSLSHPFEVLTDHSSLQNFMISKFLNPSQACWA
ncbi:hypothetical protein O181_011662 [Austropuccinia psidii MF-1]|uniref:Reverse transcriptase RNase H-like domain-containing protein n=1 Tax=Austropuccinia psidii MF-1 TaxID=1389203 RepID=A0A9Q3BW50_9BASI|nr:hypothetical protein [Austropuccinia psidii MF-1]